MEWQNVKTMLEGILDRQFYTNYGPLLRQLESQLETKYAVDHAVVILSCGMAKDMVARLAAINDFDIIELYGGAAAALTNNEELADKLRCMKSSYGIKRRIPLSYSGTGRVSEIQAGLALLGMEV